MEITGSYLFKDILEFERIRSPQVLLDLLRLLAFQIGGEVSVNELSNWVAKREIAFTLA